MATTSVHAVNMDWVERLYSKLVNDQRENPSAIDFGTFLEAELKRVLIKKDKNDRKTTLNSLRESFERKFNQLSENIVKTGGGSWPTAEKRKHMQIIQGTCCAIMKIQAGWLDEAENDDDDNISELKTLVNDIKEIKKGMERPEIINVENIPTYSQIVRKRPERLTFFIKSTIATENGDEIQKKVNKIILKNKKIRINDMFTNAKNVKLITFDKNFKEKFNEALAKEKINLEIVEEMKRGPQVKAKFDMSEYKDIDELIKDVCERNDFNDDETIKLIHEFKMANNISTVILELNKEGRKKIGERIHYGYRTCKVTDHFNVRSCKLCQQIGHTAKFCKNDKIEECNRCCENHEKTQRCVKNTPTCCHCKQAKRDHNHNKFSIDCPLYMREVERMKNKIDYVY